MLHSNRQSYIRKFVWTDTQAKNSNVALFIAGQEITIKVEVETKQESSDEIGAVIILES